MKKVYLIFFYIEIFILGFFLLIQQFVPIQINSNYKVSLKVVEPWIFSLAVLLFLLFFSSLSLIPKVRSFLTNNKLTAYLVPLQFWVILFLVLIEIILRLTIFSQPFASISTNWFGWVQPPGAFYFWGREGLAITVYEGQPGEIRTPYTGGENVIVLGDSFTEGLQVADVDKFTSVAEAALRRDGFLLDLHNLGNSGYAMADYVDVIPKYKSIFNPKFILLQVSENDFIESFSKAKTNYFLAESRKIVGINQKYESQGNLQIGKKMIVNRRTMLWGNYGRSRFEQLRTDIQQRSSNFIRDVKRHARFLLTLSRMIIFEKADIGLIEQFIRDYLAVVTTQKTANTPQRIFDENLADQQMQWLLKACDGTPLFIILIPHAPSISTNQLQLTDAHHENLKTFLSRYPQITLIDPMEVFIAMTQQGKLPMGFNNSQNPGSGHLNKNGNQVLGNLIAQQLEAAMP